MLCQRTRQGADIDEERREEGDGWRKRWSRRIVQHELMIMHGHNVDGYLPSIDMPVRITSGIATARSCDNQAMRQMYNLQRRHPGRRVLSGSITNRQRRCQHTDKAERERRPQTAYCSFVRKVLNTKLSDVKPTSTGIEIESLKKISPVEPETLISPKKLDEVEGQFSVNTLGKTTVLARGMRTPKISARRSRNVTLQDEPGCDLVEHKDWNKDIMRVLRGDMHDVADVAPTTVRIYVTGTLQDFMDERRILDEKAYPELRKYCHAMSLEFQPVDVRWGKGQQVDLAYNFSEIAKSEALSLGPNFVLLSGDLYGAVNLVSEISRDYFETLCHVAEEHKLEARHLLTKCYRRDDNVEPSLYRLQHSTLSAPNIYRELGGLIVNASSKAAKSGRMSAEIQRDFVSSDVEREVIAYLKISQKPEMRALCFNRKFLNTEDVLKDPDSATFVDVVADEKGVTKFDVNRRQQLQSLKATVEKRIGKANIKSYELSWLNAAGRKHSNEYHRYLERFANDFVCAVKQLIDRNQKQWCINHRYYTLFVEVARHARLCASHWSRFSGQMHLLDEIKNYLHDPARHSYPLVIHGEPGSGKSALLSACAWHAVDWLQGASGNPCVTIVRYIGVSQQSNDVRLLLLSMCLQLCAVYNIDPPPEDEWESGNRMARRLHALLEYVAKYYAEERPLLVLLDGIEHLETADRANTFFWLPFRCPANVHIIVTLDLNDDGSTLQRLRNKIKSRENFIVLDKLLVDNVNCLIQNALLTANRCISPPQMDVLREACQRNTQPIYVGALIRRAQHWDSNDVINACDLPPDTQGVFLQLLDELRNTHGKCLVNTTLLFISLLRDGLSEVELRDAVACSEQVLREIGQRNDIHADHVVALSNRLVERVFYDLAAFISERQVDKKRLFTWAHVIYRDAFLANILNVSYADIDTSKKARDGYRTLAELFSNEDGIQKTVSIQNEHVEINCQVMHQPSLLTNIRKYTILPYLIYHGVDDNDTRPLKQKCLCNFHWLLTKLKAVSVDGVLLDFHLVKERDCEIDLVRHFLLGARAALKIDAAALAIQLRGCVNQVEKSDQYNFINCMLADGDVWLNETSDCLLVPMFACFPSPLAPCKTKLWGLTGVLSTDNGDGLTAMKTKDGKVEIWDVETFESIFQLPVTYDRTSPNVFGQDASILVIMGKCLQIWDMESGLLRLSMDLTESAECEMGTMTHFCHSEKFERVALHLSDDDFNQVIMVVDTDTAKIVHIFKNFTVKDEILSESAAFTTDGRLLLFANMKSVTNSENISNDYVDILCYDMIAGKQRYSLSCGKKSLDQLVLNNKNLCIVTWKDCSLDAYETQTGHHMYHISYPVRTLFILASCETRIGPVWLAEQTSQETTSVYHLIAVHTEDREMTELISHRLQPHEEMPVRLLVDDSTHIAILVAPNTATLYIWDLLTSRCLHTLKAHVDVIDSIVATVKPYCFYTCSSGEGLIKYWDFCELIHKRRESRSHRNSKPESILKNSTVRQKSARTVRFSPDVTFHDNTFAIPKEDDIDERIVDSPKDDDNSTHIEQIVMMQAACISFTADSKYVVVGSTKHLPVVWDTVTAKVVCRMVGLSEDTSASVQWLDVACDDAIVVGLVVNSNSLEPHPQKYRYQAWCLKTGKPLHMDSGEYVMATACTLNDKKEIAIVMCVPENTKRMLTVTSINVQHQRILQEISFVSDVIATELHLSDDARYLVTNNVPERGEPSVGTAVFPLCKPADGTSLEARAYEYRRGNKYRFYSAMSNLTIANGLAVSNGINGDIQVWDIATCEYENNLYFDSQVDDTKNPSLHNHRGKPINHMVVSCDKRYLVCGVQDRTATVWDLWNELLQHTYTAHNAAVCRVAISHDNQLILTGSGDFGIYVWKRVAPSQPISRLYIHAVPTDLKISRDKRTVAAIGACKNEPSRFMMFKLINHPSE